MNKSTLLLVKAQAQLVISRIDKVLADTPDTNNRCYSSMFTAALKRTSMELTRSLADLRQNR